jgi:putrescine aminotransferase
MKTDRTETETDSQDMAHRILNDAEQVFSRAMVQHLKSTGLDVIEDRREGPYLVDVQGRRYLDCFSSAATYNLGRRNQEIVDELQKAIRETDQGNFLIISEEKAALSAKLADFMPQSLNCFLFTVTRGEGMEAACKLARGFTGRGELITVDGGWYGHTGFSFTLSERRDKDELGCLIPDVKVIPFNDIGVAEKQISSRTAAVILEPIQAENHCRQVEEAYLRELRDLCDKNGALLILDESQTGFGRTGYKFAADYYNVYPDLMVIGEAMSGGMFPMCAMVFTERVKRFFDEHPLIHLCTFGGHDIGCRVACKALEVYEKTKPWENARVQGNKILQELTDIVKKSPHVKEIRGMGLLISILFENEEIASKFCSAAKNRGVIFAQGEVSRASVLIRPALTISDKEVDIIVNCISRVLEDDM